MFRLEIKPFSDRSNI